jgi:hypothetical protein
MQRPAHFSTDVFLFVHPRDASALTVAPRGRRYRSRGLLHSLFAQRVYKEIGKVSALFDVSIHPENDARSPSRAEAVRPGDWMGETGAQEMVGSIVSDSNRVKWRLEVDCTKQRLLQSTGTLFERSKRPPGALLRWIIRLWKRGRAPMPIADRDRRFSIASTEPPCLNIVQVRPVSKAYVFRATINVRLMASYRGYLYYPEQPGFSDVWVKRWVVLRRPYLFFYDTQEETVERSVICLTDMKTQFDVTELEQILNVSIHRTA